MKELIDVFRMEELLPETRIKVMRKLGVAINHRLGGNFTEDLVAELEGILSSRVNTKEPQITSNNNSSTKCICDNCKVQPLSDCPKTWGKRK